MGFPKALFSRLRNNYVTMPICIYCRIDCVIFVLSVTLPGCTPFDVYSQENPYFMVLSITQCLTYKPMLTIQTQQALNKNNTSCSQENTGKALPLGRPPGWDVFLRGNNFPYFPESMMYYYIIIV